MPTAGVATTAMAGAVVTVVTTGVLTTETFWPSVIAPVVSTVQRNVCCLELAPPCPGLNAVVRVGNETTGSLLVLDGEVAVLAAPAGKITGFR